MNNYKVFLTASTVVPEEPKLSFSFDDLQKKLKEESAIKELIKNTTQKDETKNDYRK